MARSVGSEKFSSLPARPSQVALKLATSLPNVSKWASGRQKPGDAMRLKIHQTWPDVGPAPEEWDEPLQPVERSDFALLDESELEPEDVRATPSAVESEADEYLAMVRQARRELSSISDLGERARHLESLSRSLLVLGKLTGAGLNLTEARILASPQWRNLEAMITVALEPWPEAMRAVADTLKKIAGTSGPDQSGRTE